jgi:hypothetical protein
MRTNVWYNKIKHAFGSDIYGKARIDESYPISKEVSD